MSIDIKFNRIDRPYYPGEKVTGAVVVNTPSAMSHKGIKLVCCVARTHSSHLLPSFPFLLTCTPFFHPLSICGSPPFPQVVEGSVNLQLSARSIGLLEAFYSSMKPIQLLYYEIEVSAGQ